MQETTSSLWFAFGPTNCSLVSMIFNITTCRAIINTVNLNLLAKYMTSTINDKR
jgi:hypothetical protein